MSQKNILLACYSFYPVISPRSFRSFELAKEFSRLGHKVTVLMPSNEYNYDVLMHKYNIKVIKIKSGYLFNKNIKDSNSTVISKNKKESVFLNVVKKIYKYFHPNGRKFEYFWTLFLYIKKEKNVYDLTISIAMPISTHLGVALGKIFNKNFSKVTVADYGDPFTFNPNKKQLLYYRYLEKFWLNYFDYISIPIESAKEAFKYFDVENKIVVIPQGINMENIKLKKYKQGKVPHFAYAGIFYENIRNPEILFEFLCKTKKNFCFVLYTMKNDLKLVEPYIDKLEKKLKIKNFIPREECIEKLSQYDFLINMQNISSVQSPSKLVDYALTKRPVFNFDQNNFDKKLLIDFMDGNHSFNFINNAIKLDEYNIKSVAEKFLLLLEKKYYALEI